MQHNPPPIIPLLFDDLPDENLRSILQYLDLNDILTSCKLVSNRWYTIASEMDFHVTISSNPTRAKQFLHQYTPQMFNLIGLKLSGNKLKHAEQQIIVNSMWALNLTELDLSYNNIGSALLARRMRATMKSLTSLNLRYTAIGYDLKYLELLFCDNESQIRNLTSLDLSYERIGPEGASKLFCEHSLLRNLQTLKLRGCFIKSIGVQHLSCQLEHLTCLDLSLNNIENAGCKFLSNSIPLMQSLTVLNVSRNEISKDGVKCLCEAANPSLTSLDISGNYIPFSFGYLVESSLFSNLTSLSVSSCGLGYSVLKFKGSQNISNLTYLNLDNNRIGNTYIRYICQCSVLPKLKELNLSRNDLTCRSLQEISSSSILSNLTTLILDGNKIDYYGIYTILNSKTFANPLKLLEKNKSKLIQSMLNNNNKKE